jgi:hypothetical protein
MDVNPIVKQLVALTVNLKSGLRLAAGRKVGRSDFIYTIDQGLWLLGGLILLEILMTYLATEKPALYSGYGLNHLGAAYLFDLVVLMLIARIAGANMPNTGRLAVAYLASMPAITIAFNLISLPERLLFSYPQGGGLLLLLLFSWNLFIMIRLLRIILRVEFPKTLYLAGLSILLSLSTLWFLPYTQIWYSDAQDDRDQAYAKLYSLSVEDLFYSQNQMVDRVFETLRPQRPGTPDLYLVALGGYGLEKVFLNEAEYVRNLFDQRFDTRDRSLILVNNTETIDRYPLANRHNLSAALNGLGRIIDPDEDMLFLFMTSHGSRDHKFSVDFGPVPLDDISPAQLREALDDAGIRWRIIVVSSCYSGGFIDPLRTPETLIITAAADDRKSFGCGTKSEFTDFGTAYFKHALEQQPDFIKAFDIATKWIAEKERREKRTPSLPQRFVGTDIPGKLAQFEETAYYNSDVAQHAAQSPDCAPQPDRAPCAGD